MKVSGKDVGPFRGGGWEALLVFESEVLGHLCLPDEGGVLPSGLVESGEAVL